MDYAFPDIMVRLRKPMLMQNVPLKKVQTCNWHCTFMSILKLSTSIKLIDYLFT